MTPDVVIGRAKWTFVYGNTAMIKNEQFVELGSNAIHATHHRATGERYVVLAPPLFEENARLRKVLVNLSRYLSGEGYDVVRFDYRGTGFSPGSYTDVTLESARRDLSEAIGYCREKGAGGIHVVGVRFGGYLALEAIDDGVVARVVAWEPVVKPEAYIKEVLRSEVASQLLIYGEVRHDRDRLVEMIGAGQDIYVEGYRICSDLYDQLSSAPELSPDTLRGHVDRMALVYWQTRREHKRWSTGGFKCHWVNGVRVAFNHIRQLEPRPEPLYRPTLQEIRNGG
jgi:alpha/beta superfamily hydrolase